MKDTFAHYLFKGTWDSSPILREIPVRPQVEGRRAFYQNTDGEMIEVEYQVQLVERQMKFEKARGLDPVAFVELAEGIGTEMGRKMAEDILLGVTKAVESVGNVVVSEGGGITFEAFLEMNSKIEMDFDQHGNSIGKSLHLSPALHRQLMADLPNWQADPLKRAALEQVMKQKRQEFNEREARRRMVD